MDIHTKLVAERENEILRATIDANDAEIADLAIAHGIAEAEVDRTLEILVKAEARVKELEDILRERDEEWDNDVGVMRQRIAALERELAESRAAAKDVVDRYRNRLAEAKDLITWNLHLHHGISRDPDWHGSPSDAEWDDCLTRMHTAIDAAKDGE